MSFSGAFETEVGCSPLKLASSYGKALILDCEKKSNVHILHLKVKNRWRDARENAGKY
jgi:hypothetical protein